MPLPTRVSEATRRLNPQLFGAQIGGMTPALRKALDPAHCEIQKPRIRQHKGDGMNNWERQFLSELKVRFPEASIHREVSLPLCNGVRYKVDFLVAIHEAGATTVDGFEVKGRARSTGIVKIKMAAQEYPWIQFRLATKRKKRDGGGWREEIVHP